MAGRSLKWIFLPVRLLFQAPHRNPSFQKNTRSILKSSEQIRAEFLSFFEERGHQVVPSDSLVPRNDPTLLFTNAGMNQFKDVFLGTGTRPYDRAVDTQKCLRVSGKHNDLEEVGHDTYHHTFFEMLGNWSFGDYFKREAIRWAWELLIDVWKLEADRIYVTVHEGDNGLNLEADEEAGELWKSETSVNPAHVLYGSSDDNFWMMGETGPCGPCSEVHIDLRPDEERARVDGSTLVNRDDPRVMEIWNLVFIQYNALPDGSLEKLSAQHVDTGMGFERICAILQGKSSNYDTDLFAPILARLASISPQEEIRGYDDIDLDDDGERERIRIAMRVIADHIRTIAFAIADGAAPGNTGRGYVIRRILRRAVRYGYQTLGFRAPFLVDLLDPLVDKMGETFPEIVQQRDYIERVIRSEEVNFLETLGTGLQFYERVFPYLERMAEAGESGGDPTALAQELADDRQTYDLLDKAYLHAPRARVLEGFSAAASRREIPGEIAFLLHDTYGFPIDLTELMAREEGFGVDMDGYDRLMAQQRDRARAASSFKVDQSKSDEWTRVSDGKHSQFVGYDKTIVDGVRIREVRSVNDGEHTRHEIVLESTPFYAESGGQVGDTGQLIAGDEEIAVLDTQRLPDRIVHIVDRLPDSLDVEIRAEVDSARRRRIMKHHTATHLLHAALRNRLGSHVTQKGSLVAPDRLRFDFSHYDRVGRDDLRAIENEINEAVQRNIPLQEERSVALQEALDRGAMALFGEKYGDRVRVVTFDPDYSVELCGGTHVSATGEIGLVKIISEGSVAAGIRRIEALAGFDAIEHLESELSELERVRGQFKTLQRPSDEEVAELIEETRELRREIEQMRASSLEAGLDQIISSAAEVDGLRIASGRIPQGTMDDLRKLGEKMQERMGLSSVGVLGTVDPEGEKVYLVAAVSKDLIERGLQAGKLVGDLAKQIGGGGGGRPNLATAGGRQPENLDETLDATVNVVRQLLGDA